MPQGVLEHVSVHAAASDPGAEGVPVELAALFMVSGPVHHFPVEGEAFSVLGGAKEELSSVILKSDLFVQGADGVDKLSLEHMVLVSIFVVLEHQLRPAPGLDGAVHLPDRDIFWQNLDAKGDSDLHLVIVEMPLSF
jgi:hypothetical protein